MADKADAIKAVHQEAKATAHVLKLAAKARKHATRTHAATAVVAHNAMAQVVAVRAVKVVKVVKASGQSAATKLLVMHPGETAVVPSAKTASGASHVTIAVRVSQTHCAPALTP